ncbi:lytic murein transglycosylase [Labrys okinawensis]|uniref:lytic murein transglycosylase n=1 Tax=Labrys okinawensis TaxID=346911 RepID=UPI0039BD7EF8
MIAPMKKSLLPAFALLALSALPASAASFQSCLAAIGARAQAAGVSPSVFARQTNGLQPDMTVIDAMNKQPEFKTAIWDYMAGLVDAQRVADGKQMMSKYASVLAGVQRRYGVDPATVVAVWGVESNYGESPGTRPLVQSLATLSCYGGRRQGYFMGELIATLKIIQRGDVNPDHLVGSWAGAFGNTQFMPSTFLRLAVDGDGDGRRDVVDSVPDALASTANYLAHSGWQPGARWGYEVRLPASFKPGLAGRTKKRPLSSWASMGVTRIDGSALSGGGSAAILLPAGPRGPAFVVFRNFDVIYSYNAAESYALAIANLSDRIKGGGPIVTPWPTEDPGLSRAQRKELQALLIRSGYDVGTPDGSIGDKTIEAIKSAQRRLGLPVTGHPGVQILQALRKG